MNESESSKKMEPPLPIGGQLQFRLDYRTVFRDGILSTTFLRSAMIFAVIYSLIAVFASVPLILASDLVPGARGEIHPMVIALVWVFFAGPFSLAVHVGVFTGRYLRDKPRNGRVLGVAAALSVLLIPMSFYFTVVMSGEGSRYPFYPVILLLVIELYLLGVQIFSWRFTDKK